MKTTTLNVQHAKPRKGATSGMFRDEGGPKGLYLKVADDGSRSWVLRYMLAGVARSMGLGSVRDVTLQQARAIARDERAKLREKIDPLAARKTQRARNMQQRTCSNMTSL